MLMAVAAMVGLAPVMSNYPIVAVSPVSLLLGEEWGWEEDDGDNLRTQRQTPGRRQ